MEKSAGIIRYEGAASFLPGRLRRAALQIHPQEQETAEEIRIRAGQPMTILTGSEEKTLNISAEPEELETLCDLATEFSRYAAMETIREGFLTVRGGYRIGLCGTVIMKDGVNIGMRSLSSAVIRIGREHKGIAADIAPRLFRNGEFQNTLLFSPPGAGKTTLLRDLIRILSAGGNGYGPKRVALIDERGEVAVMSGGRPQMDVGPRTDILDACPKAVGIPMVLRVMNPQIIAVDEITAREDLKAIRMACGCGVRLLATVHASDIEEIREKPLYSELLSEQVFQFAVRIERRGQERRYTTEELSGFTRRTVPELPEARHTETSQTQHTQTPETQNTELPEI